jgi:hypothetical protein
MSDWFSRLFERHEPQQYQFGRGINASISPDEPELYNDSMTAFEEGKVLEAYEFFLLSLQNFKAGEPSGNIHITKSDEGQLHFELVQGSLIVKGSVSDKIFEAHALIADAERINVAIKRRLIERNYQLTYSRYYIHEGRVYLKIYLDNSAMSPQKIFFPLRELALNGDYEKEFIASEFDTTALLETQKIISIPEEEKRLKHRCLKEWVEACEESIKHLPTNDNAGMIAFTYMTLLMQVDYLIVPKRKIGREIMRSVNDYFNDDEKSIEQKNTELETYIRELGEISYDVFAPQLYQLTLTFSPMDRASHDEVATFIDETFNKIRWYKSNRYPWVIMTIYRYIPLYLLYNYGLHPSLNGLLHILVQVHHAEYFAELGFDPLYDAEANRFEKRTILQRVSRCIKPYQEQFPGLEEFGNALNFTDLEKFSYSFLLQIKHLDYSEL